MKAVVCLETVPDPDTLFLHDGGFDYENCVVRLDQYSSQALELALVLKDNYNITVETLLLDSFAHKALYDEVSSLGCDSVRWLQVPFSFDPFKRAEYFDDAIAAEGFDMILAGYHCESCCTTSIPMLIALNRGLPYYREISSITIEESSYSLRGYKNDDVLTLGKEPLVASVRTSMKLRYPTLKQRLQVCSEDNVFADDEVSCDKVSGFMESGSYMPASHYSGDAVKKAEELVSAMATRGMFKI